MTAPIVVAFDLSLTSTGVADRNGTRCIKPTTTGPQRLQWIREAVLASTHVGKRDGSGPWCFDCPRNMNLYGAHPDLVVIEGYSYASGNKAHDVGEMGGVVRVALYEAGIAYEVVSPASLKIYACGVGNASKDDVLLAAVRRLGYEGKSKDEADALLLYALAMEALRVASRQDACLAYACAESSQLGDGGSEDVDTCPISRSSSTACRLSTPRALVMRTLRKRGRTTGPTNRGTVTPKSTNSSGGPESDPTYPALEQRAGLTC